MEMANAIIVCGSGPSLTKVPFDEVGLPYAAVSTAIRYTHDPNYWLLVDHVSQPHQKNPADPLQRGPGGDAAARDPRLRKVVPAHRRRYFAEMVNVTMVECRSDLPFLADHEPGRPPQLNFGMGRSMLFAVEWLMKYGGYKTLVLAGVDLCDPPGVDRGPKADRRREGRNRMHRVELGYLRQFHAIAVTRGFRWLNWTPGSPLGSFLEDFQWTSTMRSS